MAEVVYNRLKPDEHRDQRTARSSTRPSTTCKNESNIDISESRDQQQPGPVQHVHAAGSAARDRSATPGRRDRGGAESDRATAGTTSWRPTARTRRNSPSDATRAQASSRSYKEAQERIDEHARRPPTPGRGARHRPSPTPCPRCCTAPPTGAGAHRLDVRPVRGRRGGAARVRRRARRRSGRGCR